MPAQLKRLVLKNFKSFRSASIPFAPGFTGIMGPNGAGKSNIIDAIVFVLGEGRLKLIRASRLKDLIYKKARDGKAIVSLDLVGPDGEEYQITREIDKKGVSVYRLNGKRTTKSNIVSLLAKLGLSSRGYNIVLQGDITRVIKMTPRERRTIIDEVAGISEYEERKQEALKELESVEERIKDAELILGEREAVLEKLKADRDQALRYLDLQEELKRLRKSILLKRKEELELARERISASLESARRKREELENRRRKLEEELSKLEEELRQKEEKIRELYGSAGEGKLQSLRERLAELRTRRESIEKMLSDYEERIARLRVKKEQLEMKLADAEEDLQAAERRVAEKKAQLESVKAKVDQLEAQISEEERERKSVESELLRVEEELEQLRREFSKLREQHSMLNGEYNALIAEQKKMEDKLRKIEEAKKELEEIKKEIASLESERNELFELEKALNRKYLSLQEEIKELREEVGAYRGAANALRSLGIDVNVLEALKRAQERGELFGIHDYVFRLIRYSKQYAQAIETAAGRRLFYIVVDTADAAAEAIKFLKKHNIGRATFLPMDRVSPGLVDVPREPGVLGRALDFVEYDERYGRAMAYVFGDTLVVDTIDNAKRLAGRYRAVTLDGDTVERSGIMSGGAKRSGQSILAIVSAEAKRRELSEREAEAKNIIARLQETREKIRSISNRISKLEARRKALEERVKSTETGTDARIAEIQQKMRELEEKMETLANKISELEMQRAELKRKLRRDEGSEAVSLFDQLSQARRELEALEREFHELQLVAQDRRKDVENIKERLEDVTREITTIGEQMDKLKVEKVLIDQQIAEIESELRASEEKLSDIKRELEALEKERNAIEEKVSQTRREIGVITKELEHVEREIMQLEIKLQRVISDLSELEADLREFEGVVPLDELPENPQARIEEIIREMREMEPVNMRAIDEYEEQKKRIDEVKERIQGLKEEKKRVMELLQEIERKKEKAFMDAFTEIKKRFKEVYKELENGIADLRLTNEDDIFNAGLIIEAQPQGKTLVNIDAMSGGEQSMVAIAFVLAIALYQPAAFYILDEPDQALDKKNAEKVAKYIKRLSKTTQFIVVSHRDAMLKEADQIIGVYMKQDGSSAIEIKMPASGS